MIINDAITSVLQNLHSTLMYGDRMTVYRQLEYRDDNGSTEYKKEKLYNNVPCLLSLSVPDRSVSHYIFSNPYGIVFKIFCNSSLDIRKGDYISCKRTVGSMVKYFQGLANEPLRFASGHQEIYMLDTTEGSETSFDDPKEPRKDEEVKVKGDDLVDYSRFF